MHIGLTLMFQNLDGHLTDRDAFKAESAFALRAEAAGFDSMWTPEHHFTSYGMTPDVPQFLSWIAGQTSSIRLGTMVQVLPWQDPIRTAENFVLLDHLSDGRALMGIGRGLGRVEFDGFRLAMADSRQMFAEYSEAILRGLESGVMDFAGRHYNQPAVDIRPAPYASYRGRAFASAVSPQSQDLMAELGVGLMAIAQKPWDKIQAEMLAYRQRYLELNREQAPKPILCLYMGVGHDQAEADTMREVYLRRYARSTVEHYEFDNVQFADIEGYEYYGALARNIRKHGVDGFCNFLADLQVWGTPDRVVERTFEYVDRIDAGAVLVVPSFGGMPPDVAARNFDLIVNDVLPRLKAHDVGGDIGVRHGATVSPRSDSTTSPLQKEEIHCDSSR